MMNKEDIIIDTLDGLKKATKGNVSGNCPFCGKEGHFYIHLQKGLWDCKKCGEDGNFFQYLDKLNLLHLFGEQKPVGITIPSLFEDEKQEELKPLEPLVIKHRRVFEDDYLEKERGFNVDDFERYYVFKTVKFIRGRNIWKNYICFGVFQGGEMVGFLGRSKKKYWEPKWKNSDNDFSLMLYGLDEITRYTKIAILTEGVTDKIAVDKKLELYNQNSIKAVSTFGKKISEEQIRLLKYKGIEVVIITYDSDALYKVKEIAFELEVHFKVKICVLPYGDPDEVSTVELLRAFDNLYTASTLRLNVIGQKIF